MAFSGKKYKKTDFSNVKELLDSINIDDTIKNMVQETSATTCFTKNADGTWTYKVETDKVLVDKTFTLDSEYEYKRPDGVINKTKFWLEGNTLKQILYGTGGKAIRFDRTFDGDKMVMIIEIDGIPTKGTVNYTLA